MIPENHPGLDMQLCNDIRTAALRRAQTNNLDAIPKRAFRWGGTFWQPMWNGQATSPWVLQSVVAHAVSGEQKYLDGIRTTADYFLGGNPLNMVWVTGLGYRYPKEVLHLDSWYDQKDEMVPGVVPYGQHAGCDRMLGCDCNGPWDVDYDRALALFPAVEQRPGHELWFENRCTVISNEYTVHQNIAPAAAVYGYLCGKKSSAVYRRGGPHDRGTPKVRAKSGGMEAARELQIERIVDRRGEIRARRGCQAAALLCTSSSSRLT